MSGLGILIDFRLKCIMNTPIFRLISLFIVYIYYSLNVIYGNDKALSKLQSFNILHVLVFIFEEALDETL